MFSSHLAHSSRHARSSSCTVSARGWSQTTTRTACSMLTQSCFQQQPGVVPARSGRKHWLRASVGTSARPHAEKLLGGRSAPGNNRWTTFPRGWPQRSARSTAGMARPGCAQVAPPPWEATPLVRLTTTLVLIKPPTVIAPSRGDSERQEFRLRCDERTPLLSSFLTPNRRKTRRDRGAQC